MKNDPNHEILFTLELSTTSQHDAVKEIKQRFYLEETVVVVFCIHRVVVVISLYIEGPANRAFGR